jgi:hypothetical protein
VAQLETLLRRSRAFGFEAEIASPNTVFASIGWCHIIALLHSNGRLSYTLQGEPRTLPEILPTGRKLPPQVPKSIWVEGGYVQSCEHARNLIKAWLKHKKPIACLPKREMIRWLCG